MAPSGEELAEARKDLRQARATRMPWSSAWKMATSRIPGRSHSSRDRLKAAEHQLATDVVTLVRRMHAILPQDAACGRLRHLRNETIDAYLTRNYPEAAIKRVVVTDHHIKIEELLDRLYHAEEY
jgi:hypothetical protein